VPEDLPHWDADRRELWVGECARVALPRPSPNRELVLKSSGPFVCHGCVSWTKTWSPHGVLCNVAYMPPAMNASVPIRPGSGESKLLTQIQSFLIRRERSLPPSEEQEAAWATFYDYYCHKIRKYAFSCGATEDEIADCAQEVWAELLVRLPRFRLDPNRGKFDSWLFRIVRGKVANIFRHKQRLLQASADVPETAIKLHSSPTGNLEDKEILTVAWDRARAKLSECNFQVLKMRLLEQLPVDEVAQKLGLSHEQVWYRFHRAQRQLQGIGSALALGRPPVRSTPGGPHCEEKGKPDKSAQGIVGPSVSRNGTPSFQVRHGGHRPRLTLLATQGHVNS
jgi:RNA polymerase sigma factor (sigma-70 family)